MTIGSVVLQYDISTRSSVSTYVWKYIGNIKSSQILRLIVIVSEKKIFKTCHTLFGFF